MCSSSIWSFPSFNLLYHRRKHFLPITGSFSAWIFDITLKKIYLSPGKSPHGTPQSFLAAELEYNRQIMSKQSLCKSGHRSLLREAALWGPCEKLAPKSPETEKAPQEPNSLKLPHQPQLSPAPSSSEFKFLTHKKLFVRVRKRSAHSSAPNCLLE